MLLCSQVEHPTRLICAMVWRVLMKFKSFILLAMRETKTKIRSLRPMPVMSAHRHLLSPLNVACIQMTSSRRQAMNGLPLTTLAWPLAMCQRHINKSPPCLLPICSPTRILMVDIFQIFVMRDVTKLIFLVIYVFVFGTQCVWEFAVAYNKSALSLQETCTAISVQAAWTL